jgi:hypothetical protein
MTTAIPPASTASPVAHANGKAPVAKAVSTPAPEETPVTKATISAAAIAALAVSKEAAETPAQTAQEARGNDHQAQRILARQAAAKKAYS